MPINVQMYNSLEWRTTNNSLDYIGDDITIQPHKDIMLPQMIQGLSKGNPMLMKAMMFGVDPKGLYKPK